jgi:hypothetical protein
VATSFKGDPYVLKMSAVSGAAAAGGRMPLLVAVMAMWAVRPAAGEAASFKCDSAQRCQDSLQEN